MHPPNRPKFNQGSDPKSEPNQPFDDRFGLTIDTDHRIHRWGRHAEKITGFSAQEALGAHCFEVFHGLRADGAPLCHVGCEPMRHYQQGIFYLESRCTIRTRSGERRLVRLGGIPVDPSGGNRLVHLYLQPLDIAGVQQHDKPRNDFLLQAYTLGKFELVSNGRTVDIHTWPRKQSVKVLQYLLMQRNQAVHREVLMDLLWPETPRYQGWNRLKVVLHDLRQRLRAITGNEAELLVRQDEAYRLLPGAIFCDAHLFEDHAQQALRLATINNMLAAESLARAACFLYKGNFLEISPYEEAFVDYRHRLRALYDQLQRLLETASAEPTGY